MSFHGYWFNKHSGTYITNKYPHCYVGIKQQSGGPPFWGVYARKFKRSAYWGVYPEGTSMDHVLTRSNCTRSTIGTNWDVYIENDWHQISPGSVNLNVGRMCDASYQEIIPGNVAITLFYKAVIPAFSWDVTQTINSLVYNGTANDVTSLINGGVIGVPGQHGSGGNTNRYGTLSVEKSLIEGIAAYNLPADSLLNQTSSAMGDFPEGNNINDFDFITNHYFDDGTGVQRQYQVREVDGNVNMNRYYNFLLCNKGGGSNPEMCRFAYDYVPTASNKATMLSYSVNNHLETFSIPSNDGSLFNPKVIYMLPELFTPFMMVLPADDRAISGAMALYMVFGVKEV